MTASQVGRGYVVPIKWSQRQLAAASNGRLNGRIIVSIKDKDLLCWTKHSKPSI